MKRLDVKKLVAIGVGAALIGTALAPMAAALTKSDVLKGDGTPFDVVVGKDAATSDYLWAGNIAAKLAQLATEDTAVSCTATGWQEGKGPTGEGLTKTCGVSGLSIDLTVGGTTTYSKESSKTYDTYTLNSAAGSTAELVAELTASQLGTLYNETKSWRFKGTTYTQTIKEYIGIEADAKMDYTHPTVEDLVLLLDSVGDFNYRVHYSKGLPVDNGVSSTSDFQAGDTDNVVAVLFGKEYKLYDVDTTRSGGNVSSVDKIKLVKAAGEKTYDIADEIAELDGAGEYAGQTLTVRVDNVWSSTEAEFTLLDEEGNEIDNITTSSEGIYLEQNFTDSQGDYALDTSLYLKSVNFNAATGEGNVVIAKGDDLITIQHNAQYPYSATDTDTTNDYWIAEFTTGTSSSPDANVITDITIKNSVKLWKFASGSTPVYAGSSALTDAGKDASNEAVFLDGESEDTPGYGYAKLVFNGFKGDEDTTKIKIGNNYVEYIDTGDQSHKVPFYFQLSNNSTQGTFVIDSQTFYYRTNTTDVNFLVDATTDIVNGKTPMLVDGNLETDQGRWTPIATKETKTVDLNGVTVTCTTYGAGPAFDFNCMADGNFQIATAQFTSASASEYIGSTNINKSWYYDANNTATASGRVTVSLTGSGTNDQTYKYAFVDNETYGNLWLLLDGTTDFSVQYSKDIGFDGTDTDEDGVVDASYYLPDDLELGGDSTDNTYYVATFKVDDDEDSTYEARIYFSTADDQILTLPNNNLSWYGNDLNYVEGSQSWTLRADTPDSYIAKAYTDFGSIFDVSSGEYFEAIIPQDQEKLYLVVTGETVETTTTGGTKFCGEDGCDYPSLVEGEEQKVDSTSYLVEKINYTLDPEEVVCPAGGGVEPSDVVLEVSPSVVKKVIKIGSQIVYTDDAYYSATGFVAVGGHLVNSKAAEAEFEGGLTLADILTEAAKTVVDQTVNGDWVVAGFTASDTETAAKEFIDMLDAAFEE